MPVKSKKLARNLHKKVTKQPRGQHNRMFVFVAIFVIVGGFIAVAQSFAATIPSSASGYVKHLNESGYNWTSSKNVTITSNVHKLCVATTFDTFDSPFDKSYYWKLVRVNKGQELSRPITSPRFSGNGNRDHYCFQDSGEIIKGAVYNVRFFGTTNLPPADVHGNYSILGYSHK